MGIGFRHRSYRLLLENQENSAPPSSPTREANFDTNMVIILAALLCALICALGLNSIVRCALRCSRRLAFEGGGGGPNETRHATRLAGKGLKKRALKLIPVAAYDSALNIKSSDCLICLGEFTDGEKIRVLPKCKHGFHVKCIDTWLLSHSSCPTCRQSLLEPPVSGSGSGDADVAVVVVEGNQQQQENNPVNVQISSGQVG